MLVGVLVVVVLGLRNTLPTQLTFNMSREQPGDTRLETFDYERAAEISATRWQAMANYYKDHDLLTRDDFDYEAAANNSAYRWEAMARFYEKHVLPNK